jgi:hypothetical protein
VCALPEGTSIREAKGRLYYNYVGQYKAGLREGQGTWTLYDGSKFVGIWKNNRKWEGKSFDEEGKEIGKYLNGELEDNDEPLTLINAQSKGHFS